MALTPTDGDNKRATSRGNIRVMLVDDSAVVRGLVKRLLVDEADITVVASVGNGQMALNSLKQQDTDVIILDIEMPVMDGMTALPKLLEASPGVRIIMLSTLTLRGAGISLDALEMGASDYIPKPTASIDMNSNRSFKDELLDKIRALGTARRRAPSFKTNEKTTSTAPTKYVPSKRLASADIKLNNHPLERPDIIAIGSSTGGPQALFTVLGIMRKGTVTQPILITQHMPPTFTTILAEHLHRTSNWDAKEAEDGDIIENEHVYVAPGDFHMLVESQGTKKILRLNKGPQENFCRPAVDPMFRSISDCYGRKVLAAVLTGMGADGSKGGKYIVDAGGTLIAQDEATSVVWGMPGATAATGACSAVLPLKDIAPWLINLATRR